MKQIAENFAKVTERIALAANRSGRSPDSVELVAVTKGVSIAGIETVLEVGADIIGENRVQEARQKYEKINSSDVTQLFEWHLIGHLQRNKVKSALPLFSLIHSVDSLRLLKEISRRSEGIEKCTDILLQVNTTGETGKFGIVPENILNFIETSLTYPNVRILGFMTMGKLSETPDENRPAFELLRNLAERVKTQNYPDVSIKYLSMGMSNDYEVAIEEGANLVRIGRAIFGQ